MHACLAVGVFSKGTDASVDDSAIENYNIQPVRAKAVHNLKQDTVLKLSAFCRILYVVINVLCAALMYIC